MTAGKEVSGGMTAEMNVTPLIDVLLVLLIIFMVIVPVVTRGDQALLPRENGPQTSAAQAVVLEVVRGSGGIAGFRINQQVVRREDLPARLAAIYANRAERDLFVKGDDQLSFTQVAEAIDIGHAAGVEHIGLMTSRAPAVR